MNNENLLSFLQSTKPSPSEKTITTKVYFQTFNDHIEEFTLTKLALVNINLGGTFDFAADGTFQSDTGGTFDSDIPGTFESDTGGTIKVMLSQEYLRQQTL